MKQTFTVRSMLTECDFGYESAAISNATSELIKLSVESVSKNNGGEVQSVSVTAVKSKRAAFVVMVCMAFNCND